MAEEGSSKVRLVRCPKCGNLLPELPNYSVYECGGCGALLRAKKKVTVNSGLVEKFDKDRDGEGFEKLESLSEKEDGDSDLGIASEVERGKRSGIFLDKGKDRVFKEGTLNSTANHKEIFTDGSNKQILGYQRGAQTGIGDYNDKYRVPLKQPIGNWAAQDDKEINMDRSESVDSSREKVMGKISAQYKDPVGSLSSKATVGKWGLERNGLGMGNDGSKFSQFALYPDEGPSNHSYMKSSSYAHGQLLKNFDDLDGRNRFAHLEQNRADLLRKLDELKEQISRMAENQRDTAPVEANVSSSGVPYNVPMKPLAPDMHAPRPTYFRQNSYEHVNINTQDMDMQNLYFYQRRNANELSVHRDPIKWQIPRLDPHPSRDHYSQQPLHDYYLGMHRDFVPEYPESYSHQTPYHEPVCACYHCYNKEWDGPSQVPVAISTNRHLREGPIDSNFKRHVNPMTFKSPNSHPQVNHHALRPRFPKPDTLCPSDIDSEMDVLRERRPRRVAVTHGNRRFCHPIAGGSPFVACCSCFESLNLPRNTQARDGYRQKLRCGACSAALLVEIRNKKLIISFAVKNTQMASEPNDGSREVSREVLFPEGDYSPERTSRSVDFGNLGDDHQSAEFKQNLLPENQSLNLNKSTTRHVLTSSSVSSEEQVITDSMIVQQDVSDFLEQRSESGASPTFSHAPLPEQLDDTPSNHKINRNGEGNKSNRADKEKFIFDQSSEQNSINKVSSETEVDDSFSDFLHTSISQDSLETSKEDRQPRIRKGSDSFLAGLLKKSLKDFSRSNQHSANEKANVFVNGKLIPHSMVIMAEKLAGPIQPGDYWYDSQAGFWGVMGLHCLGIIPPGIKEFNYPVPENCSSGNTGVFVNGRELHQKDLDLLASRGLPTIKDKFYCLEISGRVFEKDSGKELKGLGKLAPTVEKKKRGFGMRIPRSLYDQSNS